MDKVTNYINYSSLEQAESRSKERLKIVSLFNYYIFLILVLLLFNYNNIPNILLNDTMEVFEINK